MRSKILEKIIEHQQGLLNNIQTALATYETSTDLDEESTRDMDDMSHQAEVNQMKQEMSVKLEKEKENLQKIQSLQRKKCDKFEDGAVVVTDQFIFFVGFASAPFDFDKKKIVGISTEAPAFLENLDKTKGDKMKLGNNSTEILEIY